MSYSNDPFDAATNAGERTNTYYGKIDLTVGFVKLVKGQGKVPYTEGTDNPQDRCTEIRIVLNPIEASNLTFLVEKDMIAESGTWSRIVWPSLRDLGLKNLRELAGKWAKAEMVKTGRTYTTRRGEVGEETTFKFLAVFNNAAEATAAYYAELGTTAPAPEAPGPMDVDMGHSANGNGNAERDTALQFLGVLVKQAGGDKTKLTGLIAQMPMIGKYFTADSPEVVEIMSGVR